MRTTTLLLAGALLTTGCQQTGVQGDRSFRGARITGDEYQFPRSGVYGTTSFRNPPSASGDLAMGSSDAVQAASDRAASSPPPRSEVVSQPRAEQPTSDNPRDEVARSAAEPIPTEPAPAVARTTEPPPERSTVAPTPTPAPVERPAATGDQPTPPRPTETTGARVAPGTPNGPDPERIARANTARYPDDLKPSDDLRAAATIDRANRTVRLVNYTAQEIAGGDLWVNETYVTPLPSIASGGAATVPLNGFFDRDGRPLAALTDTSKLQLQSAGKLYNIPLHPDDLNK